MKHRITADQTERDQLFGSEYNSPQTNATNTKLAKAKKTKKPKKDTRERQSLPNVQKNDTKTVYPNREPKPSIASSSFLV